MTGMHKHWLASSEDKEGWPVVLVGASMAFHREVLKRVPAFDVELGPGALGLADDTLFSWQLEEAGYRIGQAEEATVRHHFDASRLSNASWMKAARDLGRSEAYLLHHWFHRSLRWPGLQRLVLTAKLRARRRLQRPLPDGEGAARWEMSYVFHIEKCRQFDVERKRLRNYDKRGLVKRQDGVVS
jgi:GT2 family glycosyltransferase